MPITIFWIAIFIVFYSYLGYPMLIFVLSRYFPYQTKRRGSAAAVEEPEVAIVVAAYNEAQWIRKKMDNLLSLDYPSDKLEIIWVIDGSSDQSRSLLDSYSQVIVLDAGRREGKTAALNTAYAKAKSPILVFTDANCLLNANALREIVRHFGDQTIGCVSGEKRIAFDIADDVASKGESLYWKYESKLKEWDYRYYSAVGAAGELFAVRKKLYTIQPIDTILDDFMISMRIAQNGYRIAYTPLAYAVESGSLNMVEEQKRKVRIAAGGIQAVVRLRKLLNPFRYGKLTFLYCSHRVLRWTIAPVALILLLVSNLIIVLGERSLNNMFSIILFVQMLIYLCALIGYLKSRMGSSVHRIFYVPYYFLFMNLNVFLSIPYLMTRTKTTGWEKSRRKD